MPGSSNGVKFAVPLWTVDLRGLPGGGPPLLGEPVPLELGNTLYSIRRRLYDGVQTDEQLAAWLCAMRPRLSAVLTDSDLADVTEGHLTAAREIRQAVRLLTAATVDGVPLDAELVGTLNHHAGQVPRWRELRLKPRPRLVVRGAGEPVGVVLAVLAEEALVLFAGPGEQQLCACPGPGCVLFFVRDHPHRQWCSASCGNRARAARYYARTRGTR